MISASFDESDAVLGRPPGMTNEQCDPLSIARIQHFDGTPLVVSCWKLTQDELEEFQRTGRIWLLVVGHTMPPVILTANKPL